MKIITRRGEEGVKNWLESGNSGGEKEG